MTQRIVRLGYIGAGRFSRSRLLPAFKGIPGVELAAICNSTPESSQRVAQEFGFQRVAGDWQDVVSAPDIDAVVIGTLATLHRDICLQALDADKHVLMVNPFSNTLEEAREMHQRAQEKPHLVSLVYPAQFYLREDALMRSLLAERYSSQAIQVMVHWCTRYFGLATQVEVARRWFGEHTRLFAYRKSFDAPGPATGQGSGNARADNNVVIAELENGGTITYLHSALARSGNPPRFEVYGSQGALVCYSWDQERGGIQEREGIYEAKAGERELRPVAVPPHMQEAWDYPNASIPVEVDFIAAVRDGKAPSSATPRFLDGVRLMEFVQGWRYSMDRGGWCDLPVA